MTSRRADAADLIAGSELFRGLPGRALALLAAHATTRPARRGQPLFGEGDPAESLIILVSGRAKIFVGSADGDELLLTVLEPGDSFGELTLADGGPRSASAQMLESGDLLVLQRRDVLAVAGAHPEVLEHLLRGLAAIVRRLTESSADLVFLDVPRRVAKALLARVEETGPGQPVDLRLSQGALAASLGASRQRVNEALRGFERRDWVRADGRHVLIRDEAALRRFAGI